MLYRCDNQNAGSEVHLLMNEQVLDLTTADTGASWKELKLGKVKLDIDGENKLAILPKTKKAKTIMDLQKVVLTPVR